MSVISRRATVVADRDGKLSSKSLHSSRQLCTLSMDTRCCWGALLRRLHKTAKGPIVSKSTWCLTSTETKYGLLGTGRGGGGAGVLEVGGGGGGGEGDYIPIARLSPPE